MTHIEPDPKVVSEIALEALRVAIAQRRNVSVGTAIYDRYDMPMLSQEAFRAWHYAVGAEYDRLAAALPKPGEQSPDSLDGSKSWDLFPDIADITAWLDESNPAGPHEDAMRVMKLMEEAGEAAAAYIGVQGQNPRKGVTHTMDDLLKELADVAITALAAMQHFTQDEAVTRAYMAAKIGQIIKRSDIRVRAGG